MTVRWRNGGSEYLFIDYNPDDDYDAGDDGTDDYVQHCSILIIINQQLRLANHSDPGQLCGGGSAKA